MRTLFKVAIGLGFIFGPAAAHADPILWISDGSDNIGQVDLNTDSVVAGSVHNTGQDLTDIGFNSSGTLYGTTFTGLFSINTSTGAATSVGTYAGESGINALLGNGLNLLGASANDNTVYTINSATAATNTFAASPASSAGDLAFSGSDLFESAVGAVGDELVNVTTGTVVGTFHIGSAGGATISDVFGLADDGTTMYGVAGTEVYSVDLSDAVLTPLFDYSTAENGQDLSAASGTAFFNESSGGGGTPVPEPASFLLLGGAVAGLGLMRKRR